VFVVSFAMIVTRRKAARVRSGCPWPEILELPIKEPLYAIGAIARPPAWAILARVDVRHVM
jgi:hypothetical protein